MEVTKKSLLGTHMVKYKTQIQRQRQIQNLKDKPHFFYRMENVLGALGLRYKTDKISTHGYHRFYHDILHHLRDSSFNMLEIGVERFHSIDMWKQYFPLAMIYAIDINVEYKDERICIFKGDQSKKEQLEELVPKIPKCSFIIDDGSHVPEHQLLTFDIFFSNVLEDGGVYIIEDIETSYWKSREIFGYPTRYGYGHPNSVIEKFKLVLDFLNSKYLSKDDKTLLLDRVNFFSLSTLCAISSITFAQNCIIIKKKHQYEYPYSTGVYRYASHVQ